ncbi:hypothetical protein RRG08_020831 [Elysia crispata]|uniref:Uncharacterized protein n=1 Tax=Elysia crispata TaxID=231223 RepID=A0AAE0XW40_9GAST|nr:hypothetical protein RRG08_020831 [Elysia crispata]
MKAGSVDVLLVDDDDDDGNNDAAVTAWSWPNQLSPKSEPSQYINYPHDTPGQFRLPRFPGQPGTKWKLTPSGQHTEEGRLAHGNSTSYHSPVYEDLDNILLRELIAS